MKNHLNLSKTFLSKFEIRIILESYRDKEYKSKIKSPWKLEIYNLIYYSS